MIKKINISTHLARWGGSGLTRLPFRSVRGIFIRTLLQGNGSTVDGRESTDGFTAKGKGEILPRSGLQQHANRRLLFSVQHYHEINLIHALLLLISYKQNIKQKDLKVIMHIYLSRVNL